MASVLQLDIFGGEDPVLKAGEFMAENRMKDGTMKRVVAKKLGDRFHYHKQEGRYWLTKSDSGVLITSARTIKLLKELLQEPEFFDEVLTRERAAAAVNRWANKYRYKV